MFVFVTNIWNHYMPTVCPRVAELWGEDDFRLILVRPMDGKDPNTKMRQAMKWNFDPPKEKWVVPNPNSMTELEHGPYIAMIENADVAVIGALHPCRKLLHAVQRRARSGKLTFFTNERYFKEPVTLIDILKPITLYRYWKMYRQFRRPNVHYLPINHWAPDDLHFLCGCHHRIWKWGYFPYTSDKPTEKPANDKVRIGWCGRMIGWKHVETILQAVAALDEPHRSRCEVVLVGEGECRADLEKLARQLGVSDVVSFMGYKPVNEVMNIMRSLDVYLLPSDRGEGWGVVLAEAMDKCCVPIACMEAGATLDLVSDGDNGFVFEKGDYRRVANKLAWLIDHPEERRAMGLKAWERMQSHTPKLAAERLVQLVKAIQSGNMKDIPQTGICSDVSW